MIKGVKFLNIVDLRDLLLDGERGVRKAFKLALGEAVHHWRRTFARRHFEDEAYSRYPGVATRARYAHMRPVGEVNGTENRKWEFIFKHKTGLAVASGKMRKQFWRKFKMDNRPMVFTGGTRRGILQGPFTVRGTANAVRGSWSDGRISWWGLSARPWGAAYSLGESLVYTAPQELQQMTARISEDWFPQYAEMARERKRLPQLSELPRARATS